VPVNLGYSYVHNDKACRARSARGPRTDNGAGSLVSATNDAAQPPTGPRSSK